MPPIFSPERLITPRPWEKSQSRSAGLGGISQSDQRASKAQFLPLAEGQPDLLDDALAAVVPEQPLPAVEDRIRLVGSVPVPLPLARADDRVGRVPLPAADAIPGA